MLKNGVVPGDLGRLVERALGSVGEVLREAQASRFTWRLRTALLAASTSLLLVANAIAASPQSWTTSVVPGTFPSESSALSAVRAQGEVYAYAEELQYIYQDGLTTRYVYKARPRQPDVGLWSYTGYGAEAPGVGSEEQANAATLAAYNSTYPGCRFTSLTPTQEWQSQGNSIGVSSTESRIFDMVASDVSCSTHWPVQQWRRRLVACPQYLGASGTRCVRDGIVTLFSAPLSCSKCDLRDNPISVVTGNKVQKEVDSVLPWMDFYRTYNSSFRAPGAFGGHWTHNLNVRVVQGSGTSAVVYPDGSLIVFQSGEAIDGSGAKLNYSNGEYKLELGGDSYRFNAYGRAHVIEKSSGDVVSLAFDGQQRIVRATHSSGRYLYITYYDAGGADESEIATVGDADGALVRYFYDTSARLIEARYRDGGSRHYYYEDNRFADALTGVGDELGVRYSSFAYDSNGLAVLSEHAGGAGRGVLEYLTDGSTRHTSASGAVEEIELTGVAPYRKISAVSTARGVQSSSYASYASDFRRRLLSRTNESGSVELFSYQDRLDPDLGSVSITQRTEASGTAEQRVTETWRSRATNRLVKLVSSGASVRYLLNARGQPLRVVSEDHISGLAREWRFKYCEQSDVDGATCPNIGLLLALDGPLSGDQDSTRFTYFLTDSSRCNTQPASCLYRKGDLQATTDALGHSSDVFSYDGAGRPTSILDANNQQTDYTYHPRGWLTSIRIHGDTTASDRVTTFEYWPTGLLKQSTDPDGVKTLLFYDAAHRLTRIEDGAGNAIVYTLDPAGNRVAEETRDSTGAVRRSMSRVFDALGQLVTVADASANPTDSAYDANGHVTAVTDALGRVTENSYDALRRLTKVVQDVGGIAAQTQMSYDALDRVTQVVDPKGLATTYSYNGFGDLEAQVSPDTGTTQMTYDAAGNVATRTDARGITARYSYDALNRVTAIQYPTSTNDIGYVYDTIAPVCPVGETFSVGRLSYMTDASGRTDYCYNRFGEVVRKVQQTNGVSLSIRYSYTPGGRLASLTYPDGTVADYVRDTLGRISEIGVTPASGGREVLLTDVGYLPFGPSTGWRYGNGRTMVRNFDQDYRPIGIADSKGDLKIGLGYDPVGDLVDLASGDQQAKLQYDALGRLTHFRDALSGVTIDQYNYDATGDRVSFTNATGTAAYAYPADSHRLLSVAYVPRSYDEMGNTTSIGHNSLKFIYDDGGRMVEVRGEAITPLYYKYNGIGEQTSRATGVVSAVSLYSSPGQWLGAFDDEGGSQQIVWMDELPVGLLDNGTQYLESDQIGTVRLAVDAEYDEVEWSWDIHGESFGNSPPAGALTLGMRFPGQRRDESGVFSQNYFRDYEPSTGRFLEADPLGFWGGSASLYSYVNSNPLLKTDVDGLRVKVVTSDPLAARILMNAYARMNQSRRGREINRKLEAACETYEIRPVHHDAFYCPRGAVDPKCRGRQEVVYMDPYNGLMLPTAAGMQVAPLAVVLGHELGHANGEQDDGPGSMSNVIRNENPMRLDLGYPQRTDYFVPEVIWVPLK